MDSQQDLPLLALPPMWRIRFLLRSEEKHSGFNPYLVPCEWPLDLFYSAALTAIFSILILFRLKETLREKEPLRWQLFKLDKNEILEKRVLLPSTILFLSVFSFGVVLTLVPDLSSHLGIQNKGLFFAVFTLSSLGIRLIAGRTSDRIGRVRVMRVASAVMVLAMIAVAFASSKVMLLGAAVLFGAAVGMYSPTTTAWVVDRSLDQFRGRALATMYIFLELGIGLGALVSGWLYGNESANFQIAFLFSAGVASLGLLILLFIKSDGKPEPVSVA